MSFTNMHDSSFDTNSFYDGNCSSSSLGQVLSMSMGCSDDEISTNDCNRCEAKNIQIRDLKIENRDLKQELEALKSALNSGTKYTESQNESQDRQKAYHPKTRPRIQFAKYYEINPANPYFKEGFQQFAPGAPIAVDALWLHATLSSVKGKSGKQSKKQPTGDTVVKTLMDGFFEYKDLLVRGGTKAFLETPVYKALLLYAQHNLKMTTAKFNAAWNEKMSSARKTAKRLS